jgi:hypothetical protein
LSSIPGTDKKERRKDRKKEEKKRKIFQIRSGGGLVFFKPLFNKVV